MLPLLQGIVDWRLDNLKQWIVNRSMQPTRAGVSKEQAAKDRERAVQDQKLRDSFFRVVGGFLPGVRFEFAGVEREGESYTVYVNTLDGKIPLDQLSQGVGSVIGWVGTLLQRMYEIYPDSKSAEHEQALVLIDEIDAHMHPEWQQFLVQKLKAAFKNLQVVATTHSPLVVVNMRLDEVIVVRRGPDDDPSAQAVRPASELRELGLTEDLTALRTDQVLTSPLFGLSSARSPIAAERIAQYADLQTKKDLTPDEQKKRDELRRYIVGEVLSGSTPTERAAELETQKANQGAGERFAEQVANMAPEDRDALRGLLGNILQPTAPPRPEPPRSASSRPKRKKGTGRRKSR